MAGKRIIINKDESTQVTFYLSDSEWRDLQTAVERVQAQEFESLPEMPQTYGCVTIAEGVDDAPTT